MAILMLVPAGARIAAQEDETGSGLTQRAARAVGRTSAAKPDDSKGRSARPVVSDRISTDDSGSGETATLSSTIQLVLVKGQTKAVTFQELIKSVRFDNPALVEAIANKNNVAELLVTGKEIGSAVIVVADRAGGYHKIEVTINQDASPLKDALTKAFPNTSIEVIPNETSVLLFGYVENPRDVDGIVELAKQYYPGGVTHNLTVVGPQQVQLRVMIAEVSRTKLRSLGFNFLRADSNSYFVSSIGTLVTPTSVTLSPPSFTFTPDNNFLFGTIGNDHLFRGFLRALKQEGLAKVHTDTTLVSFAGRAANLLDGGEIPIIVPGTQGTFTIEYKEYGNKIDFVPIVLGNGRIRLEIRPELSELDYAHGVVFQGFTVPGLKQRRADTSVELHTGETFVLGGLLRTTDSATTNKVPYLGDLALIGAAFRTVSYQQEEKELVIVVTPELVEPLKASQRSCAYPGSETVAPADHELFWKGNVESPACNNCEMTRRAEMGFERVHAGANSARAETAVTVRRDWKSPVSSRPVGAMPLPEQQARRSESQRPANLSGLIGPVGYEAGR